LGRRDFKYYKRQATGLFFLILFAGYFSSVTFFPHTHVVEGITIIHSHPYKSLPGNGSSGHSHTGNAIALSLFLSCIYAISAVVLSGMTIRRETQQRFSIPESVKLTTDLLRFSSDRPRAPSL